MVAKHTPFGLIAARRSNVTPPLEDLVTHCGWPLILDASPRRLAQELAIHNPEFVLFWLEERKNMPALARLIGWSRERGARPYRVVIAYQMDADVEAVFRQAGAHTFVPVSGRSGAAIADVLLPLLAKTAHSAAAAPTNSEQHVSPTTVRHDSATALEVPSDQVRPP